MDTTTIVFWLVFGIPYAYLIARVMSWAFFTTKIRYQRQLIDICSDQDIT